MSTRVCRKAAVRYDAGVVIVLFVLAVGTLVARLAGAARSGVTLRGKPATPLALRVPMQVLFIALTAWAGIFASR